MSNNAKTEATRKAEDGQLLICQSCREQLGTRYATHQRKGAKAGRVWVCEECYNLHFGPSPLPSKS